MADASGFWANLGAVRDASLGYTGPVATKLPDGWKPESETHEQHRRIKGIARLMAKCEECGTKRIVWMAKQGAHTHEGRNGIRLAGIYGIKLP